jgi:hypothetical protein
LDNTLALTYQAGKASFPHLTIRGLNHQGIRRQVDILAHGLWGGAIFGHRMKREWKWAFYFGIAPDVIGFAIPVDYPGIYPVL